MVMKASVEDDDSGWELSIPDKMEKSNTSWIDITQDFEEACRGELYFLHCCKMPRELEYFANMFFKSVFQPGGSNREMTSSMVWSH